MKVHCTELEDHKKTYTYGILNIYGIKTEDENNLLKSWRDFHT